jgi:hypothetical protein
MWRLAAVMALCGMTGMAAAKLPAPPPVDPAKAEEAKKKAAETAKKDAELLAKAQDRAVERYKKAQKGGAEPVKVAEKKKK